MFNEIEGRRGGSVAAHLLKPENREASNTRCKFQHETLEEIDSLLHKGR